MEKLCCEPVRETQIANQMHCLDSELILLSEQIEELEVRLKTILIPQEELGEKLGQSPPLPPMVFLAHDIYRNSATVNRINKELRSIFDRLEL